MSTITLTAIDIAGRKYTVTVPRSATVQQFLEKTRNVMREKGIEYPIAAVSHEGRLLDISRKLSNYSINPSRPFQIHPRQGMAINRRPINMQAAAETLEARLQDPAFHEERIQRRLLNNAANKLNPNTTGVIKSFIGLRGGKTRKSKRSKKQTRRRR